LIRRSVIVAIVLMAAAACFAITNKPEIIPIRRSLSEVPSQIGPWETASSSEMTADILDILGVDDYIDRVYAGTAGQIGLYIGYYQSQRQGDTMHSPLNCLPGAGWNPVKKSYLDVKTDAGTITINRILIQKGLDRQIVLYWYQSHGRVVASEYWGKIYTVLDAIRTNRTDAALLRVISPVVNLEDAAEKAAEENAVAFVATLFPMLGQYLPE
jgi:EpsI family protein